uniref:Uncharacterized protein n=1 Tax=Parascaris equorum TaxID=6256 RepID=A0A914RX53_PAREQ
MFRAFRELFGPKTDPLCSIAINKKCSLTICWENKNGQLYSRAKKREEP